MPSPSECQSQSECQSYQEWQISVSHRILRRFFLARQEENESGSDRSDDSNALLISIGQQANALPQLLKLVSAGLAFSIQVAVLT